MNKLTQKCWYIKQDRKVKVRFLFKHTYWVEGDISIHSTTCTAVKWKFSLPLLNYITCYVLVWLVWESGTGSSNHWVNQHQKVSLELCSNPIEQSMCNRDKYCLCWVLNLGLLASKSSTVPFNLTTKPCRALLGII